MNEATAANPWYREPGPWLLMAGPFVVVVASFITLWLAIRSNDGLVNEDYYKRGLNINQTLARSERAKSLGIEAGISFTGEVISVRLGARAPFFVPPASLSVTISHPTRAGLDQSQVLQRQGGIYQGKFKLPATGHWVLLIKDEQETWRLLGNIVLPAAGEMLLGSETEDRQRQ